ncbi:MAG TPA: MFS transporter [Bryobacteraceae bacterium]|jgi:MFS family permease
MNAIRTLPPASPAVAPTGWMLTLLTLLYTFSFVERQILSLLVAPIRADLKLGDTGVSLLLGFAFAVVYAAAGVPVARLIDTRTRRSLIGASLLLRGVSMIGAGLSWGVLQFGAFRMLSGLGLSALSPAAYSLISDSIPKERRASAIAVYNVGTYAGSGLAFVLGGLLTGLTARRAEWVVPLLGSLRPWQFTLVLVALPALVMAPLCWTLREPRRLASAAHDGSSGFAGWYRAHRKTLVTHHLGFALIALGAYSMGAWNPAFMERTYGWSASRSAIAVGLVSLIAGPAGILAGGRLADRLSRKGVADAAIRVTLWAIAPAVLLLPAVYASPRAEISLAAMFAAALLFSMSSGLGHAALQQVTPPYLRARAAGVFILVLTLVGLGTGPTLVAALTQFGFRQDSALRYSLLIVIAAAWMAGAVLLQAGRPSYRAAAVAMKEPVASA